MSRDERSKLFSLVFLIIFLTALPQIYGLLTTPDGDVYTGNTIRDRWDKFRYMAWMGWGEEYAGWSIPDITSPKSEEPVFMPLWKTLGLISSKTDLAVPFVFNLARIGLGAVFLLAIYKFFISSVIKDKFWRLFCLGAVGLAGGFGIFGMNCLLSKSSEIFIACAPADLWNSETNTFTTLLNSPMRILSQLGIVVFFGWMLSRLNKAGWIEILGISVALLLLGFCHPYPLPMIYAVSLIWLTTSFFRTKQISLILKDGLKLSTIISISSLSILYFFWWSKNDAGQVFAQYNMESPPVLNYILGFGVIFILFIIALPSAFRAVNDRVRFLAIWGLTIWPLLYFPVWGQRRFVSTLHIALTILAVWWLENNLKPIYEKYRKRTILISAFCLLLLFVNPAWILYLEFTNFHLEQEQPLFIGKEYKESFLWLKNNVPKSEIVLINPFYLGVFQMYSLQQPFISFPSGENSDFLTQNNAKILYSSDFSDNQRKKWLDKNKIGYIIYTDKDKLLGDVNLENLDYVSKIYENDSIKIFRVAI